MKIFASDNNAGACPEAIKAVEKANLGYTMGYGEDKYTSEAEERIQEALGCNCKCFFTVSGTAANVLTLRHVLKDYEAILCTDIAHINTDEGGAIERCGTKLYTLPHRNGLLDAVSCERTASLRHHGFHNARPKIVSVTQATEIGTVYSVKALKEIAAYCKAHNYYFQMDGARLANAAVSLGVSLKEITTDIGLDILSFGGAKNGLMFGEAMVFLNAELATDFLYTQKQSMQLLSKMRFVSAQFSAYLTNDLWRKNATHANEMAKLLYDKIKDVAEIKVLYPVEINAIFAQLPKKAVQKLHEKYLFYIMDEVKENNVELCTVRWMTAFSSVKEDVLGFAADIKAALR